MIYNTEQKLNLKCPGVHVHIIKSSKNKRSMRTFTAVEINKFVLWPPGLEYHQLKFENSLKKVPVHRAC